MNAAVFVDGEYLCRFIQLPVNVAHAESPSTDPLCSALAQRITAGQAEAAPVLFRVKCAVFRDHPAPDDDGDAGGDNAASNRRLWMRFLGSIGFQCIASASVACAIAARAMHCAWKMPHVASYVFLASELPGAEWALQTLRDSECKDVYVVALAGPYSSVAGGADPTAIGDMRHELVACAGAGAGCCFSGAARPGRFATSLAATPDALVAVPPAPARGILPVGSSVVRISGTRPAGAAAAPARASGNGDDFLSALLVQHGADTAGWPMAAPPVYGAPHAAGAAGTSAERRHATEVTPRGDPVQRASDDPPAVAQQQLQRPSASLVASGDASSVSLTGPQPKAAGDDEPDLGTFRDALRSSGWTLYFDTASRRPYYFSAAASKNTWEHPHGATQQREVDISIARWTLSRRQRAASAEGDHTAAAASEPAVAWSSVTTTDAAASLFEAAPERGLTVASVPSTTIPLVRSATPAVPPLHSYASPLLGLPSAVPRVVNLPAAPLAVPTLAVPPHAADEDVSPAPLPHQNPAAGGASAHIKLPYGWEEAKDPVSSRTFFVDHNTKRTSWLRPPLS